MIKIDKHSANGFPFLKIILASCIIFLAGCKADVDLHIDVEPSGAGVVQLDVLLDSDAAEALFEIDNGFEDSISDLQGAGWEIVPTVKVEDGELVSAKKQFGNPIQFQEVMAEISGDEGIFQDFELKREKRFGRVDYVLAGNIVTDKGLDAFSDSELENSLGETLSSFALENNFSEDDLSFQLVIDLPGNIESESELDELVLDSDAPAIIQVPLGEETTIPFELSSKSRSITAQVLRGAAVITALIAFLFLLSQLLRLLKIRSDRFKKQERSRQIAEMPKEPKVKTESKIEDKELEETDLMNSDEAAEEFEVVVLDGMGVIYREKNNLENILVPYIRQKGSALPDDIILKKAISLTQGRINPEQFWKEVGLDEDPDGLSDSYLSNLQLSSGVVKYILDLRERGIRIGCLTNDCTAWAETLKAKHSLESLIDIWIVSGSIGLRKPSLGMFEALRRTANVDISKVLIVDDELDVLNQASKFGFKTMWFTESGSEDEAEGHAILKEFPQS